MKIVNWVLACLCLSGCYGDAFYRIAGVVQDEDGKPISDAEVVLELDRSDGDSSTHKSSISSKSRSEVNGEFLARITTSSGWEKANLSVRADGFKFFEKTYDSGFHLNEVVVLKKE